MDLRKQLFLINKNKVEDSQFYTVLKVLDMKPN